MIFVKYTELLETSDMNNFYQSLNKPNGFLFNSLINLLNDEDITYDIIKGYNCNSKDNDIKEFNKIELKISNMDKFNDICKNYELDEVFDITKNKNKCIIVAKGYKYE